MKRNSMGLLICLTILFSCGSIYADLVAPAISISGDNGGIELSPVALSSGASTAFKTWGPEEKRKQSFEVYLPMKSNEWSNGWVSFKASKDGILDISLLGSYKLVNGKKQRINVLFDDITVEGGTIKNGNFESAKGKLPSEWYSNSQDENGPRYLAGRGVNGSACVMTWHGGSLSQSIPCVKDAVITIKLSGKIAEADDEKTPVAASDAEPVKRVAKPNDLPDTFVNIASMANMGFADDKAGDGKGGWSDQGPDNDLRKFDVKRSDFGGMNFSILDPAQNGGKAVMTFESSYLHTGLGEARFNVKKEASTSRFIYILHTVCWTPATPDIGIIRVEYDDKTQVEKVVKNKIDVDSWWDPASCPNGKVVFKINNPKSTVGGYLSKFEIGVEGKSISSVTLITKGAAAWIVLGATLSSRDLELKENRIVFSANDQWKKVDMSDVQVKSGTVLDLTAISESGPAAKHGRLTISKDGRFVFENLPDVTQQFYGFASLHTILNKILLDNPDRNIVQQRAAALAELIKRQGFNAVRPLAAEGYIMGKSSVDAEFDPERLNQIDCLFSELKKNGIYILLEVAAYKCGRANEKRWAENAVSDKAKFFLGDAETRNRWKSVAEKMLSHVNPYTGIAWKDDPSISCLTFYNEQELVRGNSIVLSTKPEVMDLCTSKWRAWLLKKYQTTEGVAKAWGKEGRFAKAPFEKLGIPKNLWAVDTESNDFGLFLKDLALDEMDWCIAVVRNAGYKGLIAQYDMSMETLGSAVRWETSDAVTMHTFFAHPTGGLGKENPGKISQESSIKNAVGYFRHANATRLLDRPFMLTSYRHFFWNKYQHEAGLVFSSYAKLQRFSALYEFDDAVALQVKEMPLWEWSASNPVARANSFTNALLYFRGDVKESEHQVEMQIPNAYVMSANNGIKSVDSERSKIALITGFGLTFPDLQTPAILKLVSPKSDILISPDSGAKIIAGGKVLCAQDAKNDRFSLSAFVGTLKKAGILPSTNLSEPDQGVFQSDTGEITMRTQENLIKVVTSKTEGVSLEADKAEELACLKIAGTSIPAAIIISAMDHQPLATSARMVFIYNTEMAFTGMEVSEDRMSLFNGGKFPVLMRVGRLSATFKSKNASKLVMYALRVDGTRQEKIPLSLDDKGILKIELDTALLKNGPTPFFELATE